MGQEFAKEIVHCQNLKDVSKKGLSRDQLDALESFFVERCSGAREMNLASFGKMLNLDEKLSGQIFDFFDMDGDGKIDFYEFTCAVTLFTQTDNQERLEAIFSIYDTDSTQSCSRLEFETMIETILKTNPSNEVTKEKLAEKMDSIINSFFIKDDVFSIDIFTMVVWMHDDIRLSLLRLGLFAEEEVGLTTYDNELTEEDLKYRVADERDETFENRKKGIEDLLPAELDTSDPSKAEQSARSKPWKTIAIKSGQSQKVDQFSGETTNNLVHLQYVYGFRCHDTRNNLMYNPENKLIYHIAQVAIKLDPQTNTQTFVTQNQDDILCIDTWEHLSVTCDVGEQPMICVWDNVAMKPVVNLVAPFLKKGIGIIRFSHDGAFIACGMLDVDNTIVILDRQKLVSGEKETARVATLAGPPERLLDMKFDKDNKSLVAACKSDFYFIQEGTDGMKLTKATGWHEKTSLRQACLSIGFVGFDVVAGTLSGKLLRFKGINLFRAYDGHEGPVNSVWTRVDNKGLISGGCDGKVVVWDAQLNKAAIFDINERAKDFRILDTKVRSVCESYDGKTICLGTKSSVVLEISLADQKMTRVMSGHFDGELWGLCAVPNSDLIITCGGDFMVAKWNLRKRELVKAKKLVNKAMVCDVSPDGKLLAVGCRNGQTLVLDVESLDEIAKLRDRSREITAVQFSPDSQTLAVGGVDCLVRFYACSRNFEMASECKDHRSAVTAIDWSLDSKVVQTNSTNLEMLYVFAETGLQNAKGVFDYKDEKWSTWTSTLGWQVLGIWPATSSGSDINSACRTANGLVLATADDFGKVKLFRFPCMNEFSHYNAFSGHSAPVSCVRFAANDEFLISIGATDKAIFQWKVANFGPDEKKVTNSTTFNEKDFESSKAAHLKPAAEPKKTDEGGSLFQIEEAGEGDQYSAVKPYENELKHLTPTNFVPPPKCNEPPDGNLYIKHTFGYRSHDAMNTAKFGTRADTVVFINAALGVVMNSSTSKQEFFNQHEDEVVSLDLSPDKRFCATGSMPSQNSKREATIFVWNVLTQTEVVCLKGFHKGAVKLLKFSRSGDILLTVGKDKDNSLALYDWQNERLICIAKVDASPVLDADWLDETTFVTVGKAHIKFWKIKLNNVTAIKGIWGDDEAEPLVACKYVGKKCFTGSSTGNICDWSEGVKGKNVPAHTGYVYCLYYHEEGQVLYSGGGDGKVLSWKVTRGSIEGGLQVFDYLAEYGSMRAKSCDIKVIDYHPDQVLLIGTRNSDLILLNLKKQNKEEAAVCFMYGHFDNEVWGLACHPTDGRFITCGGDKFARIWDAVTLDICNLYYLNVDARAVDWSPTGKTITIADMQGRLVMFNDDFDELTTYKSSFEKKNQWIEDLKYSPNCQLLAFGAHGCPSPIEIVLVQEEPPALQKFAVIPAGLTNSLLHLDWSANSAFLALNSEGYDLKFLNVNSKKTIRSVEAKDIEWATWTCKLGFPVQGIFPATDGADVNTVCRTKNPRIGIMATGDDYENVNLFRYPSIKPKSGNKRYTGHSAHVTRVRFCLNDNCLVSIGGSDKSIIIWATDFGEKHPQREDFFRGMNIDFEKIEKLKPLKAKPVLDKQGNPILNNVKSKALVEFEETGFMLEEVDDGDEFAVIKPWTGVIKPPTNDKLPEFYDMQPNISLRLEHCYGYRVKDKRNNLFYTKSGKLLYHAASIGIVHDQADNRQKFFSEHSNDVIAIALHPDRNIVATGDLNPRPTIHIWESGTVEQLSYAKQGLLKGVDNLAFSPSGKLLLATCVDDSHKVAVFETVEYKLLASEKSGGQSIFGVCWVDEETFVTVGEKLYVCWQLQGGKLTSAAGKPRENANDSYTCAAVVDGKVVCGNIMGELQVWDRTTCLEVRNVHKGSVDALAVSKSFVITGGKDCIVNIFTRQFELIKGLDVYSFASKSCDGHVRAIAIDQAEGKLAIGLISGEIYELDISSNEQKKDSKGSQVKEVMKAHFSPSKSAKSASEVWGLAVLKDGDEFLTCCDDGTLRRWSASQRKCLQILNLNVDENGMILGPDQRTNDLKLCSRLRSIDVHPQGMMAVVGCEDGTVRIVDIKQWKQVTLFRHRKKRISAIRFSPDGKMFAVGSHDAWIDFYISTSLKQVGKVKKHLSPITHIDWSTDSSVIQSTCSGYELMYFQANNATHVPLGGTAYRDEQWHTQTCVLGWSVQGIYGTGTDSLDINAVDRSEVQVESYKLLACSFDEGKVFVYRYPCIKKNAARVEAFGHSSRVTSVKFSKNGNHLISTGGEDLCVMQWRILQNK